MAGYIGSKAVNLSTTGADINGNANIDGTLTSDGLTVDNGSSSKITIESTNGSGETGILEFYRTNASHAVAQIVDEREGDLDGGKLNFKTSDTSGSMKLRMDIDQGGDISFYEDTGTTPKFFWDASAESLGIGVTPDTALHVASSGSGTQLSVDRSTTLSSGAGAGTILLKGGNSSGANSINYAAINSVAEAATAGSEAGALVLSTLSSGTTSERIRIDSSGNVGIGFSNPDAYITDNSSLVVEGQLRVQGVTNTAAVPVIGVRDDNTGFYLPATNTLGITTNGSEAMRIDESGKLLVGKTSDDNTAIGLVVNGNGYTKIVRASATANVNSVLSLNRLTSDGIIIDFQKDGTSVGGIGVETVSGSGYPFICNTQSGSAGLYFAGRIQPTDHTGDRSDNTVDLGFSSFRFDDIYATNGTIQTSDRNEKQDIAELSDAEQRVAVAAKGLMRKFRWRDAVAEKGDEARTHFGIIAQDLQAAFAAEGLDAGDYAMFISSTWTDEKTGEERTRMGVRYSELLAFIIGAL